MKSQSPNNFSTKPPFYFPSPSHVRQIKSPTEFSKPPNITLSPYYSNSNTKNTTTVKNNESFKEKFEKSQNSEEIIQNLEEKLNRNLKENYEIHQILNEKVKQIEEEKKTNFTYRTKIKELEGLLSIYSKEKTHFEGFIKEKDDEIDELKEKLQELKEKAIKSSYFELQLENYKEIFQEFQQVIHEKNKEISFLKEKQHFFDNDTISRVFEVFKEINGDFKEIVKIEGIFVVLENEAKKIRDLMKGNKEEINGLLGKNKELNEMIVKLNQKINENEKNAKILENEKKTGRFGIIENNEKKEDLNENKKIIKTEKFENFFEKNEKNLIKQEISVKSEKNDKNEKICKNCKISENCKKLQEGQIKQLREIDMKNKAEIERLFNLLNSRRKETDRLTEENKQILSENLQIKEKLTNSLQKIKNLENFFSQNFQNP